MSMSTIAGLITQSGLLIAALLFAQLSASPAGLLDWLVFWASALSLGIATLLVLAMAFRAPAGPERQFWGAVFCAFALILAGEVIENLNYLNGIVRLVDANDALFIAAKLIIIGLQFSLLRHIFSRHSLAILSFDIAAALSAVGAVLWFLLMTSREAGSSVLNPFEQIGMAAFALLDLLIIFNFLTVAMRSDVLDGSLDRLTQLIAFLGLFLLSAGDLRWEVDKLNARPILADSASIILAHAAYLLIGLAVLRRNWPRRAPRRPVGGVTALLEDIVPFAHVLAAFGLIYLIGWNFFQPVGRGLFIGLTFTVVILLLRQSLTFRTQLELRTKLAISAAETRLANWYRLQGSLPLSRPSEAPATRDDRDKALKSPWLTEADKARFQATLGATRWSAATAFDIGQAKISQLTDAMDRGWFEPWYQPIHDLESGEIVSMEVLARCRHPELGLLTPESFIDEIEEAGLSGDLARALLPKALDDISHFIASGRVSPDVTLAVNVTASELQDFHFASDLTHLTRQRGLSPDRLTLELTERIVADGRLLQSAGVQYLRRTGVKLAIDDFGAGYSSLAYLDRFQPDAVKISQSFVDEIDSRPGLLELVRSIVEMARRLRISLIVEGVERQEQVDILRDLGCTLIQGFAFSRPMPSEAVSVFLDRTAAQDN